MTTYLPHTPLGWAVAIGVILVGSACIALAMGRTIHLADTQQPAPLPSDDWMALVPSDSLSDDDPLLHDRFFALVDSEAWFVGGEQQ